MPTIRIFDGTTNPAYGLAIRDALTELAHYMQIRIQGPLPGTRDLASHGIVEYAMRKAFNSHARSTHAHSVLQSVANLHPLPRGIDSLVLVPTDLHVDKASWFIGADFIDKKGDNHIIISTNRLEHTRELEYIALHEFGHAYGAAPPTRARTYNRLGSHCKNFCIMQQRATLRAIKELSQQLESHATTYCNACKTDLRKDRYATPSSLIE